MSKATEEQIAKAFKEVFGKDCLKDFGFYTEAKYTPPDMGRVIATRAILTHIATSWKPFTAAGNKGAFDEVMKLMDGTATKDVLMLGVADEIKSHLGYNVSSRDFDKQMFATVCEIADWDCVAGHYVQAMLTHRATTAAGQPKAYAGRYPQASDPSPKPESEKPMMRAMTNEELIAKAKAAGEQEHGAFILSDEKNPHASTAHLPGVAGTLLGEPLDQRVPF